MGQITPFIGIYIPAAGERNYEQSFASGMINIDQHDHSGGPNKGVPITASGLADFSVTFKKLNTNVVNPSTGIGVDSGMQNQLIMLGLLKNIYQLVPATGFIGKNGALATARTFQNTATATWTNPDGAAGNPSVDFNIAGISPVPVANGGTGKTSLSPYDIIVGGTSSTTPVQQVSGEGNLGDVLSSQGPSALPAWTPLGGLGQIQYASVTLSAAQINNLSITRVQIVPAPGVGKVIVPLYCYAFQTFVTTRFTTNGAIVIAYGSSNSTPIVFNGSALNASSNLYIWAPLSPSTGAGSLDTSVQNQPLNITNLGPDYTAGGSCTVKFLIAYNIITL